MSKASDLGYWVKDHGGVVFAAIMVVALVAMFVAAIVVSSQQPEAEPEDTVSGGYVGSWYHVEYDKAYVLTLNGDGTARYYDKTLVQPLMFGKWEVGENMKVSFFEPEGEQPNASAGEEFAFYTTPNEDGSIPSSPATLSYKGSYSSSQIWLFWPSKAAAEAEWAERNPNKAAVMTGALGYREYNTTLMTMDGWTDSRGTDRHPTVVDERVNVGSFMSGDDHLYADVYCHDDEVERIGANPDPKPEREPLVRKKLLDKRYLGGLLYLKVGELVVVDRLKDVLPMEAPQGGGEVEDAEVDLYWDEAAEAEDAEV